MLLAESELNVNTADSILDESILLDESESITKLPAIPVLENNRLGCGVVNFTNIESITEDYGCDYEDAFCAIVEQNELDPDYLAVSVEDWKLIETPELANMVPNIVVKPISENNIVYQAVDYCINEYYETNDEEYLDYLDELSQDLIMKVAGKHYKRANDLANLLNTDKQDFLDYYNSDDDYKKDGYSKAADYDSNDYYFRKRNFGLRKNRTDDIQTYADYKKKVDDLLKRNEGINKLHHWGKHNEFKSTQNGKKVFIPENENKDRNGLEDTGKKSNENINKRDSIHSILKNSRNKTIAMGTAAGLIGGVGGVLLAKKIAALRKQQRKHPGLRGKLQAIINKLKSKLHK